MNTSNPMPAAPAWAIASTLGNDDAVTHRGPDLSTDPGISTVLEQIDFPIEGGHETGSPSITVRIDVLNDWIDLDQETVGDPAAMARRISTQLLLAAEKLEAVRAA